MKVLQLTKYSGVGFWSQYPGGVVLMTNTTPLALDAGPQSGDSEPPAGPVSRFHVTTTQTVILLVEVGVIAVCALVGLVGR